MKSSKGVGGGREFMLHIYFSKGGHAGRTGPKCQPLLHKNLSNVQVEQDQQEVQRSQRCTSPTVSARSQKSLVIQSAKEFAVNMIAKASNTTKNLLMLMMLIRAAVG